MFQAVDGHDVASRNVLSETNDHKLQITDAH